jgi:hypothetical protein
MKVKLTREERDLLLSTAELPAGLIDQIRHSKLSGDGWTLDVDEDDADRIRDACGEKLQEIGFNKANEATPSGKVLETLIDKFFIG